MEKQTENSSLDFKKAILLILLERKLIFRYLISISIIILIITFILPKQYKSTTIFLPETDKNKVAGLAGISNLAAIAGINVGNVSLEQLYPTIINSEEVLKKVIYAQYNIPDFPKPINLIEYWEIEEDTEVESYELALKKVRNALDVTLNKVNNVVTINIWTTNDQLSTYILDTLSFYVDDFIRIKRITNASEQRKWIESRLNEVKSDLVKSEEFLKKFRESNRRINDSPTLVLEQDRLAREVILHSSLYSELRKQYELAKIEEIKNIPIINILDHPRAAGKKDYPKRAIINVVCFFLNTIGVIGYILVRHIYSDDIKSILNLFKPIKKS